MWPREEAEGREQGPAKLPHWRRKPPASQQHARTFRRSSAAFYTRHPLPDG